MELTLIPWVFGMGRLGTLMELRTGEKIPVYVTFCIKYFIPLFIFAIFIISWITEFQYNQDRVDAGWTTGIAWAGRMIMFIPMLIIPIGYFVRIECEDIDSVIAKQYGIKVERDGSYVTLDNFNNGEPMGTNLKDADANNASNVQMVDQNTMQNAPPAQTNM